MSEQSGFFAAVGIDLKADDTLAPDTFRIESGGDSQTFRIEGERSFRIMQPCGELLDLISVFGAPMVQLFCQVHTDSHEGKKHQVKILTNVQSVTIEWEKVNGD